MFAEQFGLPARFGALDAEILAQCAPHFAAIDAVQEHNQLKVLNAFTGNRVGAQHFAGSSGYGYGDAGRDLLDRVFADAVGAEDALCRVQFMSGTHALTVALFGLLRTGDTMLSVTGAPYDTLHSVIGLSAEKKGGLSEFGILYKQVDLPDGRPDLAEIERQTPGAKMIYIQRSRGYGDRAALNCSDIGAIVERVRAIHPRALVVVDNCYGEFCETTEPLAAGADLIVGSLIKNPGGAIAETGGYIAGRADLVELCAHRLTAPGTGREIGSAAAGLRNLYLGLYLAPSVTAEAMKTAVYASALFARLGYTVSPRYDQIRSDIITAITLNSEAALRALCAAVQACSPVDSFAVPEPWDMPGYDSKIIMASGAFTCGSSIELSCDAPVKPPYTAYLQGGINLTASRYALLRAAERMENTAE